MTCCTTAVRVCARDDAWFQATMTIRDSRKQPIDLTGVTGLTWAGHLNDDTGPLQFTLNLVGTDVEGFRILAPAVLGSVAVVIAPATLQAIADDSGCALLRGSLIVTWPTGRTSSQPLELQIEGVA